jgi:hypothetical protein
MFLIVFAAETGSLSLKLRHTAYYSQNWKNELQINLKNFEIYKIIELFNKIKSRFNLIPHMKKLFVPEQKQECIDIVKRLIQSKKFVLEKN